MLLFRRFLLWNFACLLAFPAWALPPSLDGGPHFELPRRPQKKPSGTWASAAASEKPIGAPDAIAPASGTVKLLVIPMAFSDVPPSDDRTNSTAYFEDLFFGDDTTGEGEYPFQSVRGFYREQSFGKLNLEGVVLPWGTAANTMAYYANLDSDGGSSRCFGLGVTVNFTQSINDILGYGARKLVEEALAYAIAEGIDLNDFDNDGDGVIDGIVVVHAGISAELIAGQPETACDYLWSHQFFHTAEIASETYDVQYLLGPERFYCPANETLCPDGVRDYPAGIGIFAHEFGHMLGLPDLYGKAGQGNGVGYYSWMSWGIYGWNGLLDETWGPDVQPTGVDPWSCVQLGWCEATTVADNQCRLDISAFDTGEGNDVLRVDLDADGSEYYLVSLLSGRNSWAILGTNAVTIWHIDDSQANPLDRINRNVCVPEDDPAACAASHYWVSLEQKDGNFQLERGVNRGDTGDLWRLFDRFGPATVPSSCAWDGSNCDTSILVKSLLADQATLRVVVDPSTLPPAPQLLAVPTAQELKARAGRLYSFEPRLLQGDGPDTRWHLTSAPQDMTIDDVTGKIEWTPTEAGSFEVSILIENCAGDYSQSWLMVVSEGGGGGGCSVCSVDGEGGGGCGCSVGAAPRLDIAFVVILFYGLLLPLLRREQ